MSGESNAGEIGASMPAASSLPAYLRAEAQYGTIVCTEHRTAYTPDNIENHLVHSHRASKSTREEVHRYLQDQGVSSVVREPVHGSAPIRGLQVHPGWQCVVDNCSVLSKSKIVVEKHCSKQHSMNSKRRREEVGAVIQVSLQHWFAKSNKYWLVDFRSTASQPPTTPRPSTLGSSPPLLSSSPPLFTDTPYVSQTSTASVASSSNILSQTYSHVVQDQQHIRQIFHAAEHPSELTPWNHVSRYYLHFTNVDMGSVAPTLQIPRRSPDHPRLFFMVQSLHRVLQTAYREVPLLHPVAAKRLNSFETDRIRQDPFTFLQNATSLQTYLTTFKQMICYIYRVHEEDPFEQPMFQVSPSQQTSLETLYDALDQLSEHVSSLGDAEPTGVATQPDEEASSHDPALARLHAGVDDATLSFLVALLLHDTRRDPFHSAIYSFCAAISWSSQRGAWKDETQSGSLLSQMVYCCQLVLLAEARRRCTEELSFIDTLTDLCRTWAHNDAFGPLGDILRLRLYAMKVGRELVRVAPIRWRQDGETLMYQDITYRVADIATEITFCLDHARRLLHRDLCLGVADLPTFDLRELEDNWDDQAPGHSFLDDIRNASVLDGYTTWLLDQIAAVPELYTLVVQSESEDDVGRDRVRSTFAHEYEASVQQFLGYLAILMHKGSGQPARATEFLGLRWQNLWQGNASRNLYVHDGHLLFVLDYHKTRHASHASRYPVRFLLPDVAQLLLQYLVLVMPLRHVCQKQTEIPAKVSEYLWHDGSKIWPDGRLTQIGRSVSQQAHGVAVNMSSWRQMAVGIAIKRFAGLDYQADLDMPTDEDDDLAGKSILDSWGGAMADVFHHQAAHTTHTGNRAYGGTVNFNRGLTDAGLQEYFRASRLWHQLCQPQRTTVALAGHRRQASGEPVAHVHPALRQRLAFRERPIRHRLRWGSEQVRYALGQVFPRAASVAFRSPEQAALIEAIVTGCPEVIGVLGTGGGKSLAFMLPACLPRAGLTVVIVPLVALKADLLRRCQDIGLSFSVWQHHQENPSALGVPLLFVSVEQAVHRRFRAFLGQQDANQTLDRVVIDEAHLVLTAQSYRPKMALVRQLRQIQCQIVCLTGTLPPIMQAAFESHLHLHQPRVVRSPSFRRDITYRLQRSSDTHLTAFVVRLMRGLLGRHEKDATARLLLYTTSRAEADQMSEQLSCPKYYSDSGTVEEKQAAAQQWRQGQSKVMVATGAFGMGIDYPAVRQVVHMGVPSDMINFAQEVGRLSRDGRGGVSRIILPKHWRVPPLPSAVDQRRTEASRIAMQVYVGENRCLAAVLSRFVDGEAHMQYCSQDPLRCSSCKERGVFDPQREQDPTQWWDATTGQGQGVVSDAEEEEEEEEESFSVDPFAAGSQRLRQFQRETAVRQERYRAGIALLRGRCMICMILRPETVSSPEQMHELTRCPGVHRPAFQQAKKAAMLRNTARGGWMRKYVACYHCGQPQSICPVAATGGRPADCQYRDMVFPAAWAMFQRQQCWGRTVGEISGVPREIWQDESRWMDWLGQECDLHGFQASQAARMLDEIMQLALADQF